MLKEGDQRSRKCRSRLVYAVAVALRGLSDPARGRCRGGSARAWRTRSGRPDRSAPPDRGPRSATRCHRVARQTGRSRPEQGVGRDVGPAQVAGQRHNHHGGDRATVEGVTLDDDDGLPIAGLRSARFCQIGPTDVAQADHHSVRRMTLLAAARLKPAGASPRTATARSIASVRSSGACRATDSRTAAL